jgi:hypothetical protein
MDIPTFFSGIPDSPHGFVCAMSNDTHEHDTWTELAALTASVVKTLRSTEQKQEDRDRYSHCSRRHEKDSRDDGDQI